MDRQVDVVILGGGPAGAATALVLARAGRSVALLERSHYERPRVGESLPPQVRPLLYALGVWDRFQSAGAVPSPGVSSAWGDGEVRGVDFMFSPFGNGWHIDRQGFDALLAEAAETAGVFVYRGARLGLCRLDDSGAWRVESAGGGESPRLRASMVVDATGRAAWLARRQGARRIAVDHLTAVIGCCLTSSSVKGADRRTLVEAVEDGWWYAALLPDGRQMLAFLTDRDLLPSLSSRSAEWCKRLERTAHIGRRLERCVPETALRTVAADSSRLDRPAGTNWLAVGDAAAAVDPLSSQGVYQALRSGIAAARVILEHGARPASFEEYAAQVAHDFSEFLRGRAAYYGRERRWPDSLFWARRFE